MLPFVVNHMTVPNLDHEALFELTAGLGGIGVELRNDLARPLFDGAEAEVVAERARGRGLRIVGLSQVYPFNAWSDAVRDEVAALIATARAVGAETISLIPRNDGQGTAEGERQANARRSLMAIKPMLEDAGMVALVEPLGFESSSLRSKAETVEMIEEIGAAESFRLVHDTFHHHLAGGGPLFPQHTGIVHVSGVVDPVAGGQCHARRAPGAGRCRRPARESRADRGPSRGGLRGSDLVRGILARNPRPGRPGSRAPTLDGVHRGAGRPHRLTGPRRRPDEQVRVVRTHRGGLMNKKGRKLAVRPLQ